MLISWKAKKEKTFQSLCPLWKWEKNTESACEQDLIISLKDAGVIKFHRRSSRVT